MSDSKASSKIKEFFFTFAAISSLANNIDILSILLSFLKILSGSVRNIPAIIGKKISDMKKKKHPKNTDNF